MDVTLDSVGAGLAGISAENRQILHLNPEELTTFFDRRKNAEFLVTISGKNAECGTISGTNF